MTSACSRCVLLFDRGEGGKQKTCIFVLALRGMSRSWYLGHPKKRTRDACVDEEGVSKKESSYMKDRRISFLHGLGGRKKAADLSCEKTVPLFGRGRTG